MRRLTVRETPALLVLGVALVAAGLLLVGLAFSASLVLDIATILLIGACWEAIWVVTTTTVHFGSPEGTSGAVMGAAVHRLERRRGARLDPRRLGVRRARRGPSLIVSGAALAVFGLGAVLRVSGRVHDATGPPRRAS